MGFKINISGGLEEKLKGLSKELIKEISDEMEIFGNNTVSDAKKLAPTDQSKLKNSIKFDKEFTATSLGIDIIVAADYAAYVEFGTGKFAAQYVATLPAEWKTFAAQFKGKGGGTFEAFVMRIVEWVKRKGIGATYNVKTRRRDRVGKQSAATTAEADAYAIALYIIRNGIHAHPFLYPSIEKNRLVLIKNLKAKFE